MKQHKKVIFVVIAAVLVVGATLGAVAMAQADDQAAATAGNVTNLMDRVAAIYQANTGTAIDSAALQAAFAQAGKDIAAERQDQMWQKLVDEGKMTQEQVDAMKAWLAARPEGIPAQPGQRFPAFQRGLNQMGKMFRGFHAPAETE